MLASTFLAFGLIETISGQAMRYEYLEQPRKGDHICYISDLSKLRAHYPQWTITKDLQTTFREIHNAWVRRVTRNA